MVESVVTRRGLLQAGGGVAAASLVAAAGPATTLVQGGGGARLAGQPLPDGAKLPATPPARRAADSVGFAIVGLGGYALNQMMPRFPQAKRAHVAAIVSGNPEKLRQVGDAYGVPADARHSYETFDRIAADKRIEAVYVVLPTGLHAEWVIRAFAAGKHVLCEKPMALSSADCERMIAAGKRAGRKLMIAYRSHFEPYNVEAMRLMRQKAVGTIRLLRTEQSYRMGPTRPSENWRTSRALAGGGPLEDYGIYGLQSALYLTGEMPESISATTFRPAGDPRFAEILAHVSSQWRFPSGAVAQLVTSYDSAGINFAEVRGTEGVLKMDPATSYSGQKMWTEGRDARAFSPGDPEVQFAGQLDHFTDAIRTGSPIRTPGEMGLRDLRLMEAIYASAERGQTVRLAPDGRMRG
ncbi:Gfo/Idh/MocA family protein [Sphingomonas desiccabilis]|uniref:Gfo/Idh/MocA family oxidoreductase n=1 Tax=Sphingomonas desiccabilis TaxID=429134 RepID=A0A4Q2IT00_9SPHN|nr:Gfo/Idh/MocA family oxidoreductase [Sphingomonas desiccabilis]MBB3912014.1 glucose-fructose oxidoreductase [Sphingomonas desiccabilis]RXZ31289.1 Gfo/Idh/MocA family oxidoreductase [Sphingomonas desiccabilis]